MSTAVRIAPPYASHQALSAWIREKGFKDYEKESYSVGPTTSARVKVYQFHLAPLDKEVMMKVSAIDPDYHLARKIELLLRRSLRGDHNANAFDACRALAELGFPVAKAIGLWSDGIGFARKTYFLYEKITANSNAETLMCDLQKQATPQSLQCADALLDKILSFIASLHHHGWRHGDPVPKNFLLNVNQPISSMTLEDIAATNLHLIDYDRAHKVRLPLPALKTMRDLKDLRDFVLLGYSIERILQSYGATDSELHKRAFSFWIKRRYGSTTPH